MLSTSKGAGDPASEDVSVKTLLPPFVEGTPIGPLAAPWGGATAAAAAAAYLIGGNGGGRD
jgi:hypothetical protein